MAASRLDEAVEFLVSLVSTGNGQTAERALEALSIYRGSERVGKLVEEAVMQRQERALMERFRMDYE